MQGELKGLEVQLDALQSSLRRMSELSGGQADEKEDRNEGYYQRNVEDARSFLSVYEQALTMSEQAGKKSSRAQSLLRQEKDAWIQVRGSEDLICLSIPAGQQCSEYCHAIGIQECVRHHNKATRPQAGCC